MCKLGGFHKRLPACQAYYQASIGLFAHAVCLHTAQQKRHGITLGQVPDKHMGNNNSRRWSSAMAVYQIRGRDEIMC